MGNNFKGILEVIAYKACLPLQPKSAKLGTKVGVNGYPRYLYSLTFSIV